MKIIKHFFEFIFVVPIFIIFKIIGYKNATNLGEIIGKGDMPSKIAKTYPLTKIKEAITHAANSGSDRDGKIILLPNT